MVLEIRYAPLCDQSETNDEWKTPVTIVGSHDCRLLFFEPMISWKWISGGLQAQSHYPTYEVSDLQYNKKTFEALPHSWSVSVSPGCQPGDATPCKITITVEGPQCPSGGCNKEMPAEPVEIPINCMSTSNTYFDIQNQQFVINSENKKIGDHRPIRWLYREARMRQHSRLRNQ